MLSSGDWNQCMAIKVGRLLVLLLIATNHSVYANTVESTEELEYGAVLFEYFQQQYFSALVEHEYSSGIGNKFANQTSAKILKGGMMLSYGMADESREIFEQQLSSNKSDIIKNRIWFYLAKLYYQKNKIAIASETLQKIQGKIPEDIHPQYHYLATLINIKGSHLKAAENIINGVLKSSVYEPYLLYNLAVTQVKAADYTEAVTNLQLVTKYGTDSEELATLSDRARHGLAKLAIDNKRFDTAWFYLQNIRTAGLYSNRALLSYGWSAIQMKQFDQAIPALQMLDKRSIAIAEVQEAKVLLPHLYEQQGASRKALKGYLLAEKSFKRGINAIEKARKIIAMTDIPEEFVNNLELIASDSDWYGVQPDVNYKKLTPFLIDLMASHVFQTTLKELGDLYALRKNLMYWSAQAREHELILGKKISSLTINNIQESVNKAEKLKENFNNKKVELKLYTLIFDVDDQKRFNALLQTTEQELDFLDDKITSIKKIDKPYRQPDYQIKKVRKLHLRIKKQLKRTNLYIEKLEPIMRGVVNAELDKHDERMRYYWAQARLAKARLYDSQLNELDNVSTKKYQQNISGAKQ